MKYPSLATSTVGWTCKFALVGLFGACVAAPTPGAAPLRHAAFDEGKPTAEAKPEQEPYERQDSAWQQGIERGGSVAEGRSASLGSVTARLTRDGVLHVGRATLQIGDRDPCDLPEGHWRLQDQQEHPAVAEKEKLLLEIVLFMRDQPAVYVREFAGANADSIVFLHTVALIKDGDLVRVFGEYVADPRKSRLTFPGNGTAVWQDVGTVLRLDAEGHQLIERGEFQSPHPG